MSVKVIEITKQTKHTQGNSDKLIIWANKRTLHQCASTVCASLRIYKMVLHFLAQVVKSKIEGKKVFQKYIKDIQ